MNPLIEPENRKQKHQRPQFRGARNPKRLFVPVSEFGMAAFSIRPRPMRLARTTKPNNHARAIRVEPEGVVSCQQYSS